MQAAEQVIGMSVPAANLSLEWTGDARIVRVREAKLTYPVLSAFFAEVCKVVEEGAPKLILDLEAVTYIDSATIACLVEIHRLVEEHGGVMRLTGLRRRVETMLSMTGVHRILGVYHEEAEALASFH